MHSQNTIDSLISTSIEQYLPPIPTLAATRFAKPFSKEEIKGWNTNIQTAPSPQQISIEQQQTAHTAKGKPKRKDHNLKTKDPVHQFTLKTIKQGSQENRITQPIIDMFQTFSGFPDLGHKQTTNFVLNEQVDYVQGKKMKCPLPFKQAHSLRPLFRSIEDKKTTPLKNRSVSVYPKPSRMMRSFSRRDSDSQKQKIVRMISFPLQGPPSSMAAESQEPSTRAKLSIYMRKYNIKQYVA